MNYRSDIAYQLTNLDIVGIFLFVIIPVLWIIFTVILYVKFWFACNDLAELKRTNNNLQDINKDLQYWARARYESDKRKGVITMDDMDKADAYINPSNSTR